MGDHSIATNIGLRVASWRLVFMQVFKTINYHYHYCLQNNKLSLSLSLSLLSLSLSLSLSWPNAQVPMVKIRTHNLWFIAAPYWHHKLKVSKPLGLIFASFSAQFKLTNNISSTQTLATGDIGLLLKLLFLCFLNWV